ncbi:hypothetical protein KP735_02810 [Streptococcus equi subsp. zooepidemicus]|uniref:hypothetical protein n=1 Tax=Streptococcus equi TaxID=1336 RepID=UPI0010C37E42|nr:hypothetical protein [Streptococcus equi]MCD3394737.1 hypothetical protein [Streptococcus equi subsp. zooepidemicus]MCD3450287.1 hypothetical protein [Streptococcus equi subsp. zooepidemicus]WOK57913.1 hypothetical protein RIM63_03840 [Streptococcus equi subsp. zooepidemicus]VTP88287.1 Phage protein [Streptococcus equi subsp. zooepidemicus]HEK9995228.1 hypothetical protein [Streptococcus equi subsp. zooepidemicus]
MAKKQTRVTLLDFAEKIHLVEGKTLAELTNILGFNSKDTTKGGLAYWKRNGKINYKCQGGIYSGFELTDLELKSTIHERKNIAVGRKLKAEIYFKQVTEIELIMATPAISVKDKLKAIELQQKALQKLSDDMMAELTN